MPKKQNRFFTPRFTLIDTQGRINDIKKDTTQKIQQDKMLSETIKESEEKTRELLNQCDSPFTCTSSCPDYTDVGQKNCQLGEVCCMQ